MTLLMALGLFLAAVDKPAPAAGVLVSLHKPVRVERAGAPVPGTELGMRLMKGDVVVVGAGGSAMLYLAGGEIERVPAGARFEVAGAVRDTSKAAGPKLASSSMRASESGLWVLNDPDGSILVAAMRGSDEAWTAPASPVPLSPRYETSPTAKPRFIASGIDAPTRLAVTSPTAVIWRSPGLSGGSEWTFDELPALDAGQVYRWRLESDPDGAPLSEWVPFRVPSAADDEAHRAFEAEMAKLAASPDGAAAADILRCGRYLETSSWTALLGAASRILKKEPESTVARRARESAVRGLRLSPDQIAILAAY